MPLKPSGQTPTTSPRAEQPLGVGVAGQRGAALARQLADDRRLEHQVGAEHPQVAVGGMVVEQRDLGHHRVERDGARVVGHDQRTALGRDVLQAARLDPEVVLVQRPQRRQQHVLGELGVEAELVDLDVAGQPAADERERGGHLALPLRQLVGRASAPARAARRAAPRPPARSARPVRPVLAAVVRRRAGRAGRLGSRLGGRVVEQRGGPPAPGPLAGGAATHRRRRRRPPTTGAAVVAAAIGITRASGMAAGPVWRRCPGRRTTLLSTAPTTSGDNGPRRPCRVDEVVEGLPGRSSAA